MTTPIINYMNGSMYKTIFSASLFLLKKILEYFKICNKTIMSTISHQLNVVLQVLCKILCRETGIGFSEMLMSLIEMVRVYRRKIDPMGKPLI